jgi:hypothetical protein
LDESLDWLRISIEEATGTESMNSKKILEDFNKRLETMRNAYLECMDHFDAISSEQWKVFCESRDEQKYNEYLSEIEFKYRNTLNSSMLIVFCSLTEYVLADITNENVPGYEKKMEKAKGDWLVKNIKLLNEHRFNIDPNGEDVRLFSCYIKIRNCLAHSAGKISKSKYPEQLNDAINAVEKYAEAHNLNMRKIKDDYLMLESDLVSDVVVKSVDIIERILE